MKQFFRSLHLNWTDTLVSIFGSAFLAFGLYNVHALSGVTEGGVLGLTLLLDHWFSISPSVSGAILNVLCYAMGWKLLGRRFLAYSFISTASFSLSYKLYEQFPPLFPEIANHPLLAALVGAMICFLQQKVQPVFRNAAFFQVLVGFLAGSVIWALGRVAPVFHVNEISIGVIMLVIPGAALTNAVRDMLVGHTISGLLRLAESLLLALMLAIGFGSAIYLFGA